MSSSPQLYRSFQSGWLIHQPLVHSLQYSSPSAERVTIFGGVLRKCPCLEAFKAVWGISWVPPAAVLPASDWPCCQSLPLSRSMSPCLWVGKRGAPSWVLWKVFSRRWAPACHAGGCEIEGWAFEESWGEISALYFLHFFGFVSFVLAQRSFAILGQFSLSGGSSPIICGL